MICLDNTDLIEGDAEAAAEVDYTIHGHVGSTFTQLAAGQLPNAKGTLYTAGAATSVVCITLVNTGAAAQDVNLYIDPDAGGNSRRLIPQDVSLGIGYSLHFDGQRISVMDIDGQIIHGYPSPLAPTKGGTGLATYTKGDLLYASAAEVLGALGIGTADYSLFTNPAGDLPEWGLGLKFGRFTFDTATASGTQMVGGLGFKPSHVIFLALIDSTSQMSIGFDDGTLHYSIINQYPTDPGTWLAGSAHSIFLLQTAAIYSLGLITTFGADGFTVTWTKVGAKTGTAAILYMAFR